VFVGNDDYEKFMELIKVMLENFSIKLHAWEDLKKLKISSLNDNGCWAFGSSVL